MLASFLVLLVVSTGASLLVLRAALLSRTGEEAQETLTRQVNSLRALSQAGSSDNTLEGLFDDFLDREQPLSDGVLVTYVDGSLFRAEPSDRTLVNEVATFANTASPNTGELPTADGPLQFVAVPVEGSEQSGVLVAARLLRSDRADVENAIRVALGVSAVVMMLASLFIWLAAGRALEPLRALARTTRTITETDLSERVVVSGQDEIANLGRTYNGMLDRLQSAFADQKEFLADVGHELRTPITVIKGHLETAGDDPVERIEANAVINDELDRMSRLVDDLLLLARSDRPDFLRVVPLDLDLLTHDIFAKARSLGVRRWLIDNADVGLIHADPHRLTSAVMNLAQNAVKHTRGDQAIAIGSAIEGDVARIWVRDEGEGIAAHEQERIFERFAGSRVTASHGSGLGLAIVKAIAEAHDGHVELHSKPGAGSTFTIVIPATEPPPSDEDDAWLAS